MKLYFFLIQTVSFQSFVITPSLGAILSLFPFVSIFTFFSFMAAFNISSSIIPILDCTLTIACTYSQALHLVLVRAVWGASQ